MPNGIKKTLQMSFERSSLMRVL